MIQRTGAKLAGPAVHLLLKVNRVRIIGFRPANMRGAKESYDGTAEGGGKMPRAAVRRDEKVAAPHARLG